MQEMDTSYHRYDIGDEVWALLSLHLPSQRGQWGGIQLQFLADVELLSTLIIRYIRTILNLKNRLGIVTALNIVFI